MTQDEKLRAMWGRNIREARQRCLQRDSRGVVILDGDGSPRHLSQAQLADRIGVSQQAVARWESGEAAPTPKNQWLVSRALGVPDPRLLFPFPFTADDDEVAS